MVRGLGINCEKANRLDIAGFVEAVRRHHLLTSGLKSNVQFLHPRTSFIDFFTSSSKIRIYLLGIARCICSSPTSIVLLTDAQLILSQRESAGSIAMACRVSAAPTRGVLVIFFLVTTVAAAEDDEFAFNIFSDVAP